MCTLWMTPVLYLEGNFIGNFKQSCASVKTYKLKHENMLKIQRSALYSSKSSAYFALVNWGQPLK